MSMLLCADLCVIRSALNPFISYTKTAPQYAGASGIYISQVNNTEKKKVVYDRGRYAAQGVLVNIHCRSLSLFNSLGVAARKHWQRSDDLNG